MEEPRNICLTCLSTDRRLVPLHKITVLLQELHFVKELKESSGGVCWECQSTLVKFFRFKNRARIAQDTLSQTTQQYNIKSLTTLTLKTKVVYDYKYTYNFDPLTNTQPKAEPDSIKQENVDQSDDNIDYTSDLDEKLTDLSEKIENIYEVVIETKYNNDSLKKQEKSTQNEKVDSNNHIRVIPNEEINEITENVFAETIETKPNKHLLKRTIKRYKKDIEQSKKIAQKAIRDTEKDEKEFQAKFVEVVLSEEEMVRVREEKRNHYNFKKIPYKCDSCVLGFTKKETYSVHMKKKHDASIGNYLCDVCSIRFPHKLAVNMHKRKHYVVYRCRLCKYEAHEFWSAHNHCKSKHVADKINKIHCSQCDVVVKNSEDLEKHMQTEHSVYCDECGVKFKGKSTLRSHKARIHAEVRVLVCDICRKTFNTKSRLESHMARHNVNIAKKLSYCQLCNIQYKNLSVYRSHLKSSANHSERAYPCPECNSKFASKAYRTKHYNFYHLKKSEFNCEICNKIFISDWRLKNHKQKHHGLSRSRDHSCNMCNKKFFTPATLRSHQLTHSDQRSFMCEDCGDTFKQSAALYTHTRLVHKGGGRKK